MNELLSDRASFGSNWNGLKSSGRNRSDERQMDGIMNLPRIEHLLDDRVSIQGMGRFRSGGLDGLFAVAIVLGKVANDPLKGKERAQRASE